MYYERCSADGEGRSGRHREVITVFVKP